MENTIRYKDLGDGDGVSWAVYPRTRGLKSRILTDWDEDFRRGYYSGPGQSFSHGATIRMTRTRVLVKQHHGLDI